MAFWMLWLIPGILDNLWPLWDRRGQTVHDKVARTVVIHVEHLRSRPATVADRVRPA